MNLQAGRPFPALLSFRRAVVFLSTLVCAEGTLYMTVDANGVYVGQVVQFRCYGSQQPDVKIQTWLVDGVPTSVDTRITTSPPAYNNRLTIKGALTSDSGIYTCATEDGRNASQNLVVYCSIIPFSIPVTRAVFGSNITLRCDGKCYEYIFWAKNGTFVDDKEPERFYSPGNGSILYITNVKISDNGSFLCEFLNARTAYSSVELLVLVPSSRVMVSSSSRAKVGHDFEIRCQSDGIPLPESVSWYNNSLPIDSIASRVTSQYDKETGIATLSIRGLARYNLSIECRFKQELLEGQPHYSKGSLRIIPIGKPDPPRQLLINVILSNPVVRSTVRFSWTPPVYTGHLDMLAYRVAYWDASRCRRPLYCNEEEYWLPASVLSHEFDLQAYTNHTRLCFTVQSINNDGLSDRSEIECIGVSQPLTSQTPSVPTTSPTTSFTAGTTMEPPTSPRPSVRTHFQVVLKNVVDLCSGLLIVTEESLTNALAAYFNTLFSNDVVPTDLTTYAVIQLGGLIHYIGCIHSPDSDRLVSNLSSYIRAGNEQLRLPNSYFVFLASCPTRISGELCKIADEDMEAASCKVSPATTDTPTSALYHSPDGNSQCLVGYATLSGLLAVAVALLILLTFFYCRHRRRNAGKLSEDRKSVSQASTCSSEVTDIDLRAASSGRVLIRRPSGTGTVERGRPSCDSAICEDDFGSESELYNGKIRFGERKGKEETKV